jgi:hypothetical protein
MRQKRKQQQYRDSCKSAKSHKGEFLSKLRLVEV